MSDAWYAISALGSPELWLIIILAFFLFYFAVRHRWKKSKKFKGFMFILVPSIILVMVLAYSVKASVQLPRPCIPCPAEGCNPYCVSDSTFPSGHAATIFAAVTAVFLGLEKRKCLLLYAIAFAVSYSRVALGVHTWLDIAGGAVLGIAVAIAVKEADKKVVH
jgi:membrane-associated phospholipid phosphatase